MLFLIIIILICLDLVIFAATYDKRNDLVLTISSAVNSFVTCANTLFIGQLFRYNVESNVLYTVMLFTYIYWYFLRIRVAGSFSEFKVQAIKETFDKPEPTVTSRPQRFQPASQQKRWVPIEE